MIIKKNRKIAQEGAEQKVPNEVNQEVVSNSGEEEKDIDLFDLDNIDFKQRQERRRGDRRRGFRRIDDRNLISRAKEEANSIREAAAKEGYQEGLSEAKEDIERVKEAIGEFFSKKHTTIMYSCDLVSDKLKTDEDLKISIEEIKASLRN